MKYVSAGKHAMQLGYELSEIDMETIVIMYLYLVVALLMGIVAKLESTDSWIIHIEMVKSMQQLSTNI